MNLTKTASLIKSYLWLIILFFVALISIILIFMGNSVKKTEAIPNINPPQFEHLNFKSSSFNVSQLVFDNTSLKNLPVYKLLNSKNLLSQQGEFISKLVPGGAPKETSDLVQGKGVLVSDKKGVLQIYPISLTYMPLSLPQTKNENILPDIDDLKNKTVDFFNNLPLPTQPLQDKFELSYTHYVGHDSYNDKNPQNAGAISIVPVITLSSIKVYTPRNFSSVMFNPSGEPILATYRNFEVPSVTLANYPLVDPKTASNMLNNYGNLVSVSGPGEIYSGTKTPLDEVILKKAYLAYYLPSYNPNIIQPVWVFEGESKIENTPINVVYALPAINPKYLIAPKLP